MKILVVEDDPVSSTIMRILMSRYGKCDCADSGLAGVTMFGMALESGNRYDLVCLDIMLPEMDGQQVLARIRKAEKQVGILGLDGVKILMVTALADPGNIMKAFSGQCEGYIIKPIRKEKIDAQLAELGFALPDAPSP